MNPDSPQRWVRKLALERGITVVTPTPRLKGALRVLDPARIPRRHYADAATIKRGGKWGQDVALTGLPTIELVVMGSVAVTRDGRRVGKGQLEEMPVLGELRRLLASRRAARRKRRAPP